MSVGYTLRAQAEFKNFKPIQFDAKLSFIETIDGQSKVADLGTHLFVPVS